MSEQNQSHQSFDDFWAERQRERGVRTRTEVILGVEVVVPARATVAFKRLTDELMDQPTEEHLDLLLGELFGPEAYADWVDAGIDDEQLVIVLAWGAAHAAGKPLSFAEVAELVDNQGAEGNPSAANRAQRRAASTQQSRTTGGRSKPTSGASTKSRRRR